MTGAASGIGLATVLSYLDSGAAGVVAVDIAEMPLQLRPHLDGGRLRFVRGDVGDEPTAIDFTRTAVPTPSAGSTCS